MRELQYPGKRPHRLLKQFSWKLRSKLENQYFDYEIESISSRLQDGKIDIPGFDLIKSEKAVAEYYEYSKETNELENNFIARTASSIQSEKDVVAGLYFSLRGISRRLTEELFELCDDTATSTCLVVLNISCEGSYVRFFSLEYCMGEVSAEYVGPAAKINNKLIEDIFPDCEREIKKLISLIDPFVW